MVDKTYTSALDGIKHIVGNFLTLNGFTLHLSLNRYDNDKCAVYIRSDHYELYNKTELNAPSSMYSSDLQIYWLIGVLTYYDLMDKNYVR